MENPDMQHNEEEAVLMSDSSPVNDQHKDNGHDDPPLDPPMTEECAEVHDTVQRNANEGESVESEQNLTSKAVETQQADEEGGLESSGDDPGEEAEEKLEGNERTFNPGGKMSSNSALLGRIGEDEVMDEPVPESAFNAKNMEGGGIQELESGESRDYGHHYSSLKYAMSDASRDLDALPSAYKHIGELGEDVCSWSKDAQYMREHMAKLVAYTPELDMLRLSNCQSVTDNVLEVIKPLTGLTFLDLSRCDFITDSGMECLSSFSNLTHLDLDKSMTIGNEGVQYISTLTKLTFLDIGRRPREKWLARIASFTLGGNSAKIKKITDEALNYCLPLVNMQWLSLANCDVSNSGLELLSSFTQLEKLDLGGCDLTDSGLESLGNVDSLRRLSLRRCDSINDEGLMALGTLTNLLGLDLGGCDFITNEGLAYLVPLQNLRTLNLANCKKISYDGLTHIGYLYAVNHLDLSGLDSIFGYGMDKLAELRDLWWLNLSCCTDLTDDGLKTLKELKYLKLLALAGCVKLTFDGVMNVLPSLPKLMFLDLNKTPRISRSKLAPLRKKYTLIRLQQV